jgi:hypothetical protein
VKVTLWHVRPMRSQTILGLTLVTAVLFVGCGDSDSDDEGSSGGKAGSTASGGSGAVGGTGAGRGGSSGANNGGSNRGGAGNGGSTSTGGSGGSQGGAGGQPEGGAGAGGAGAGGDNQGGAGAGGDNSGGSGGTCMRITNDASAIGVMCEGSACPTGYTCKDYNGVILQQRCAILCQNDCECPMGLSCNTVTDKVSTWRECGQQ